MRLGGALAASALAALLFGAASCKPSSLSPFTGTRDYSAESTGVNGLWQGQTVSVDSRIGQVQFTVASNEIADLSLTHSPGFCGRLFTSEGLAEPIEGETFVVELFFEAQGRFVLRGRFETSTTCSGTYFFEAIRSTAECPTNDSGSFVATITQ